VKIKQKDKGIAQVRLPRDIWRAIKIEAARGDSTIFKVLTENLKHLVTKHQGKT